MAFYRDQDNAIWQTGISDHILYCIADPDDEDNEGFSVGLALGRSQVDDAYGPLIEIEPTGWKEV